MAGFYFLPNQTPHIFYPVPRHFLITDERIGLMITGCSSTKLCQSSTSLAFQPAATTNNLPCELIDLRICKKTSGLLKLDYDCRFPNKTHSHLCPRPRFSHDQGTQVSFCDQLVEAL